MKQRAENRRIFREAVARVLPDWNPELVEAHMVAENGWSYWAPGRNLFNLKAYKSWTGDKLTYGTTEFIDGIKRTMDGTFRGYVDIDSCLRDYKRTIRLRWPRAYAFRKDPAKFFKALQSGKRKYATRPDYAKFLYKVYASVLKRKPKQVDKYEGKEVVQMSDISTVDALKSTGKRAARAGVAAVAGVVVASIPEVAHSLGGWAMAIIPALMAFGKFLRVKYPKIANWIPV